MCRGDTITKVTGLVKRGTRGSVGYAGARSVPCSAVLGALSKPICGDDGRSRSDWGRDGCCEGQDT